MRYEVRVYHLEEMLPENRMTYEPCYDREDAKQKYKEALESYNDSNHIVDLCEVTYGIFGESVVRLASSQHENPRRIVWEEETL